MESLLTYLRLQMKLRWGSEESDKKSRRLTAAVSVVTFAVILLLEYVLIGVLVDYFSENLSSREIAVAFMTLTEAALTVTAVAAQIKWLLRPSDVQITARFPVSPFGMFVANLVMIYINLTIYSLVLTVSMMGVLGIATGMASVSYFGGVFVAALIGPVIPFAVSVVVAVPTMFLLNLLENHNYIKLFIFITGVVVFFVAYDYILRMMADYFIYQRISNETADLWDKLILALNSEYNPFVYAANFLFFRDVELSLIVNAAVFALFAGAGTAIAKPVYDRVRNRALEGKRGIFNKKTALTSDGAVAAVIKKEFKEIIRTRVYAYFYLGIAIATPVMVFFCNRLVKQVGEAQIGSSVAFGTSVLVITAFMAMINVFSANIISKEGTRFYLTKIIPVSFTAQLAIKSLMNLMVSAGALAISCFVIGVLKFVAPEQIYIIVAVEFVMAAGFIFNGFNLNVRHPYLKNKANGDVAEINTSIMMAIGLAFSAVLGGVSIVLAYDNDVTLIYYIISAVAGVYFLANALIFFTSAERKYNSIEP